MTQNTSKTYDFDLVFDESEVGGYTDTYFGLLTDYGSVSNVLVRFPRRLHGEEPDAPHQKARSLSIELLKRWNAHDELVSALKNSMLSMAQAFDRIHSLPRTTDTTIASNLDTAMAQNRAALAKVKGE